MTTTAHRTKGLAGALLAAAAACTGQNLITNGEFAKNLDGWYSALNGSVRWGSPDAAGSPASGSALEDSATMTAPAGALTALVELGVEKLQARGILTPWFDNVSFAPATASSDTLLGWLPVAGSTPGSFGSFFKTSLQVLNPNTSPLSGRIVFHPAGQSESPSDPSLGYSLAPGQSFAWDDVVAAMGQSGLGSLDVTGDSALFPPVVVTRIFNDAGAGGTSGFTEPVFQVRDQFITPIPSVTVYLLPPDLDRYRYNVGIRVLYPPVTVTVAVLDAGGNEVHTVTRSYETATVTQTTADDFAGVALENGQTLKVAIDPELAILYGATVDNVTNDPSAQFQSIFPEFRP